MTELADFENLAVALKERETAVLRDKTELAYIAVEHDRIHRDEKPPPRAARWLAHLWSQSTTHTVNRLARMFEVFNDDEITPDVPLKLYGAAMDTDDPQAWLERALAEGWSSRELRDAADIIKGKHLSSCQFAGEVEIVEWDVPAQRVAIVGLPISGQQPGRARATVREVLEK